MERAKVCDNDWHTKQHSKGSFVILQSSFFEFSVRVLKSDNVDQVWALLLDAMRHRGFDRLLYVSTRVFSAGAPALAENALVLTNHQQEMVDAFVGEELYLHSPSLAWGKNRQKVINWRAIEDKFALNELNPAQARMRDLSRRLGVMAGYTVSLENSGHGSRAVIGLCAQTGLNQDEVDEIWLEYGDEIMAMCNLAHLKMGALPQTGLTRPLTTRQCDVLLRVSDGEITQEIAKAMGLTVSAVEKILRQARKALGVRTTVQAVKLAVVHNLLSSPHQGH